jgi:hypothetical protein
MSKFLDDKIRLVNELVDSGIRVGYEDLALILCTVISASAARRWPGPRIDRKRFVELLANQSPPDAHTSWVSIAALVNKHLVSEADTPFARNNTRIFRDDEIDLTLGEAAKAYPHLAIRDLKRCSYAALIYEWLRCGYAHEYGPDEHITQVAASRQEARVSYIGRRHGVGIRRMVSFHIDYLITLAQFHAANDADRPTSQPLPAVWWIETNSL